MPYPEKKASTADPAAAQSSRDSFNTSTATASTANKPATDNFKIDIPSISLPKGGGAIKGIDEKFEINAVNGSANFSIPIPTGAARGFGASLGISYNSGGGNGIVGLGWSLSLPSIRRKTEKELPQYFDETDSDTYVFSGAEDLVPFLQETGGVWSVAETDSADGQFKIKRYRPRIEGTFARIERWTNTSTRTIHWRVISKDNITSLFGDTTESRIADPADSKRIFEWLLCFSYDDKGNCAVYEYKPEDAAGINPALLHNKNRTNGNAVFTNTYLKRVRTGNIQPYHNGDPVPEAFPFLFETVFDYGEHDALNAPFTEIQPWPFRGDAFSDYRAGFEIRTCRLCNRVLLYHHFTELPDGSALVSSLDFTYDNNGQIGNFTFLKEITSTGYIKQANNSYTKKSLPPISFTYQKYEWSKEVKFTTKESMMHAPAGIYEPGYQWVDLYSEGLNGILTEQAGGLFYKQNLGQGNFSNAKLVSPRPSFSGIGSEFQLQELEADGTKYLSSYDGLNKGFFKINDDEDPTSIRWQPFQFFEQLPNIDFNDANTKLLDLNGDGKAEILITEDNVFSWYPSLGEMGFDLARKVWQPFDEEKGPHIVFSDKEQSIFLSDINGDGLTDIVRIKNGSVCYWPNLGYGKFGAKVSMDNAPVFDHPDQFNAAFIKLADIDGSGTTDIIYLGKNQFKIWLNQSGNHFLPDPKIIEPFPEITNLSQVSVIDFLGNGTGCIVWSSSQPKDQHQPLRYIDLMKSKKPHLMVGYKNNMGKEVELEYTASTHFYLQDRLKGQPWITKLPFPVHCLSKTITYDRIMKTRFASEYSYHHGYYDHAEREFRGFGRVEQMDTEHFEHWIKGNASNIVDAELHQEPVLSKTWAHTGAFLEREKILHQFAHEYWYEEMNRQGFSVTHSETGLPDAHIIAAQGISPIIIDQLSVEEWRQALRACKGMTLRSEIFAQDAPGSGATTDEIKKQLTPYSVATHNCVIELLQPKGQNKFAVFAVKESEAITYNYERDTSDPRISHHLNIKLDEYGNILESASVVYPRVLADTSIPAETQLEQSKTVIIYTQNQFTNDVITNNAYRLRLPSEAATFELKGVTKTGAFFGIADFENILASATEVNYHEIDISPAPGTVQKRLIEKVRTTYYRNDLSGPLPLHQLESLALPFENYQLAYTPELVTNIYGTKVNTALLTEGKFTNSEADANWWIRSGTIQFTEGAETAAIAQNRFYVPISYTDAYGAKTRVKYYGNYFLFIEETEDTLGNKSIVDLFNFRTLSPQRMRDNNGNLSEAITDELGFVKALAVFGKGNEADDLTGFTESTDAVETTLTSSFFTAPDSAQLITIGKNLLQHATTRFVYDVHAYKNTGKPVVVASIAREEHFVKNNNSPVQISFEYSNGLGGVVMKKVQAEPGMAKQVVVQNDNIISVSETDTAALNPKQLRWIGNGRIILNNKGNPVKQYEPYFSATHRYEDVKELVETGVTPIIYYDAMGRQIKTDMPDGTFSKIDFDSWKQTVYDANDTILPSSWYINRTNRLIDAALMAEGKDPVKEKAAADKAALHANTPDVLYFDTLGRPVLSVEHHRNIQTNADEFYLTKTILDTEGNQRSVTDARGNTVMQYKYDMLGNKVYQNSMDAGQRWLLINILGNPLRTWDERNHEFQYFYDVTHRPTHSKVLGGDGSTPLDHIFDRVVYGESLLLPGRSNEAELQAVNVLGKPIKHFDTGGLEDTPEYDFKGQPLFTIRKLFRKYKEVGNWTDANLVSDLENDAFTFTTETDALGRITKQTAPDGSIITPSYNEAGLLTAETVLHPGSATAVAYIKDIDYNEKGQRNKIVYGNDVSTRFYYDKETFRLKRLETKRQNNDPLQEWYYTFDPVGNITHIEDKNIPVVFFDNQKITGVSEYTYDAGYRLVQASGRENNVALPFTAQDNWNDAPFIQQLTPGDPVAMRNYTQHFQYDGVGNILQMRHQSAGNNWTRDYAYQASNNRLISTQVVNQIFQYPHHAQHGFITVMPHLEEMNWNFKEELVRSVRQRRSDGGAPETTYYQYDVSGQRIRKITENQGAPGITPTIKEERIYISGYELYKKHSGADEGLERVSLSLMDQGHRFVMIETRNDIDDGTEKQLVRYQLHNHLGSAALELNHTAQVISYEEYHPFGTTAYQATNAIIKAAAKRYRYTGMERDEETGLEYHSARYYLPWLGRWMSTDPAGLAGGPNLYAYVSSNPISKIDSLGLAEEDTSNVDVNRLAPGNEKLNKMVNDELDRIRQKLNITPGSTPTSTQLNQLINAISELGLPRGADFFSTLESALTRNAEPNKTKIEKWAASNLPSKAPGDKYASATILQGPAWWVGQTAVNPSIVLEVKDGSGSTKKVAMGTDKLGHFFAQGYEYYEISVLQGKGDKAAIDYGVSTEEGKFGLGTTGVFSNADLEANKAGLQFYKDLRNDPFMKFDINNYATPQFSEQLNPNQYSFSMELLFSITGIVSVVEDAIDIWKGIDKQVSGALSTTKAVVDTIDTAFDILEGLGKPLNFGP